MKKSVKTAITIIGAITVAAAFFAFAGGDKDPNIYAITLFSGLALLAVAAFTKTKEGEK